MLASAPRIDIDKPFEPPTGDDAEDAEEASQAASPSPKKGGRKRVAGAKRSGAENVKGKGGEKKRRKAGAPERGELEIGADHPSQSNGEDAAKGTGKVPGKKRILGRPAGALSQLDINRPSVINPRAISSAKARAPLASQMAKDDTVQGVVAQVSTTGGLGALEPVGAVSHRLGRSRILSMQLQCLLPEAVQAVGCRHPPRSRRLASLDASCRHASRAVLHLPGLRRPATRASATLRLCQLRSRCPQDLASCLVARSLPRRSAREAECCGPSREMVQSGIVLHCMTCLQMPFDSCEN